MLGTARLLTFAFRGLVLLLLVSALWIAVADGYTEALVSLAGPLVPDGQSLKALGSQIHVNAPTLASPVTIDGLTLHFGMVLVIVLVLAATDLKIVPRLGWLLAMAAAAFVLHVLGVALLARGVGWASESGSPEDSGRLVFSLFAVFWGLLPPAVGGVWCYAYWLPRASDASTVGRAGNDSADSSVPACDGPRSLDEKLGQG
ncbi:MAG: hypothetical protein QF467_01510 [SAR202 cluster bacterium]|nr:hypothetical protein [SAR202 cluster bacterium]